MKTILYISATLLLLFHTAIAQKDTSVILNEINISSTRLIFNSGLRQYSFDTTVLVNYQHLALSDLLNENSAICLKNYGSGELSVISLRGGSAYHTDVLWNGFSVSSPTLGLTDLTLEKNFFFDDITIQYGGTSSLWGSGAVSGSIHLDNNPGFNSGLKITTGINAGSFSNYSQLIGINWGSNNYYGTLKFINDNNKNNFLYIDENTQSKKEQINSQIKQYGFMNENYFRTGKYSVFNFRIWYTNSDRQIPPVIQQVNSQANQKDINTRYSAEWKHAGKNTEYAFRSAYFHEKLDYSDDFLSQPSNNKSKTFINEAEFEKSFSSRHIFQAGINYTYSVADSSVNFSNAHIGRLGLFSLYRYHSDNEKIELSLSCRQEFSSLNNSPFTSSAGINYYLFKGLLLRSSVSNVYRNPSLNDLYWIPGGNTSLRPENGFSAETGFQADVPELIGLKNKNSSSSLIINSTVYFKQINDWIIWYPSPDLIWRPQNLLQVKSRGAEISAQYHFTGKKFSAGCDFEFFYTLSTNEKPLLGNDASLHCQLIYVPLYRWNGRFFVLIKNFGLNYNHSYTGYRYTTSDNTEYLEPYTLDNLQVDKLFPLNSIQLKIFFRVENIFNSDYQSVLNRPMPLRSYQTGVIFTFIKK